MKTLNYVYPWFYYRMKELEEKSNTMRTLTLKQYDAYKASVGKRLYKHLDKKLMGN